MHNKLPFYFPYVLKEDSLCWFLTMGLNFKLHIKTGRTIQFSLFGDLNLSIIIAQTDCKFIRPDLTEQNGHHSHLHPPNRKMPTALIQKWRQLQNNALPLNYHTGQPPYVQAHFTQVNFRNTSNTLHIERWWCIFDILWATGYRLQQMKTKGHFSPLKRLVHENSFCRSTDSWKPITTQPKTWIHVQNNTALEEKSLKSREDKSELMTEQSSIATQSTL